MVSKYQKIRYKSGGNNSIDPFSVVFTCVQAAFGLFLSSVIQIILETCPVAIIVLCGVMTIGRYPKKQNIIPLSVHFIIYFKVIQTKTYTFHVSILSKSISDKIMAIKRLATCNGDKTTSDLQCLPPGDPKILCA